MKRSESFTIIRSKGRAAQMVANGVIEKENARQREEYQRNIQRLKEQHAREMAQLKLKNEFLEKEIDELKKHRNKLLMQKYCGTPAKRSLVSKVASAIGII